MVTKHYVDADGRYAGAIVFPEPDAALIEVADDIGPPPSADYLLVDGAWQAPPSPPQPVPETISDRQFAQGLAKQGLITTAEALAWVGPGALPAAMVAFLDGLPAAERFDAEIILTGATEFCRSYPLTAAFGQATGMDSTALDDFWRFCATL